MAHLFIHGVDAAFHLRLAAGDNITTSSTLLTSPALFSVQIFSQNTDSPLIFAANAYCLSTIFLFSNEKPSLPSLWQKAIAKRFVWHGIRRDIRLWCKECPDCQASKIHRHTRSPLTERLPPSDRFRSLHIDLVGPLPESQGMTYLFTIIDRFTRWPKAVPLPDAHASTCTTAFLHHWVARFGVPEDITSDRGRQFTSLLWTQLNNLLGIEANTTTAYHPQANGMVERLHRQLKASLKARTTNSNWFPELPMVLLGIRSSWRVDPGCSPAELVYGSTL
ncbi:Pol polyprotein [Elysia marginata]|uniref:Pol polyprotein n=1 Tax=Elysia marginata TaxID=1093978 RepID=A0AAV4IDX3_9GAST|nr:Pol polyprotein [Elysia marginata]